MTEPCTRGTLGAAHHSSVFLDEVAGSPISERITAAATFEVIQKEFLATALRGRIPKHAPRTLTTLLCSLEDLAVDLQFCRISKYSLGGFLCDYGSQTHFTMKCEIPHRWLQKCAVTSNRDCLPKFLENRTWSQSGWTLLQSPTDFDRDCLLELFPRQLTSCWTPPESGDLLDYQNLLDGRDHIGASFGFWP